VCTSPTTKAIHVYHLKLAFKFQAIAKSHLGAMQTYQRSADFSACNY
jgi:hypothetical protein